MSFSPTLGRFLERDPEEYVDGLNPYQYERSNPVTLLDPAGLASLGWIGGGPITLVGDGRRRITMSANLGINLTADEAKRGTGLLWQVSVQYRVQRQDPPAEVAGDYRSLYWNTKVGWKLDDETTVDAFMGMDFLSDKALVEGLTAKLGKGEKLKNEEIGFGCTRGVVAMQFAVQLGLQDKPEAAWTNAGRSGAVSNFFESKGFWRADPETLKAFEFTPAAKVSVEVRWDFFDNKDLVSVRVTSSQALALLANRPGTGVPGSVAWAPLEVPSPGQATDYSPMK